jgi:ribosomal protein RSM22 (predicted rRNA methylase)
VARGGRPRGPRGGARSAIHDGLVGERALVGTPYLADAALRREYARDIAPRTRAALARILAEVFPSGAPRPRRALDLGTGTGAAVDALRAHFGADLDVIAVDRVAAPGVVTANLAVELPAVDGRFDVVVAAHLLGELYVDRPPEHRVTARARRVRAWASALLARGGTVILVEPALRETSRELLAVRDQLLALSDLEIIAPCFWTGPCPALANPRDWCHDAAEVLSRSRVDFSYLVLREAKRTPGNEALYRVVSDPLPEKGRLKLFGCGPAGRHPFVRLERDASPSNAAFAGLVRGDVMTIERAVPAGDGHRVTPATAVTHRRIVR